ncbi:hypothetical protein ACXN5S_09205 [Pseudoroseicyclus sp. H15]
MIHIDWLRANTPGREDPPPGTSSSIIYSPDEIIDDPLHPDDVVHDWTVLEAANGPPPDGAAPEEADAGERAEPKPQGRELVVRKPSEADTTAFGPRFAIEPIFTIIDYVDCHHLFSRRRITMRHLEQRGSRMLLCAYCHEREGSRMFRLERIASLIDGTDVAVNSDPFFSQITENAAVFALDPVDEPAGGGSFERLRFEVMPAVALLATAARIDDRVGRREADAILGYITEEASELRHEGVLSSSVVEPELFRPLVEQSRLLRMDLDTTVARVQGWGAERKARLETALGEIIADVIDITGGRQPASIVEPSSDPGPQPEF